MLLFSMLISSAAFSASSQQNNKTKTDMVKAKQAFVSNCQACHALNKNQVGPSVVELKKLYSPDSLDAFLQWTKNPGKKRADSIQMPAMSHLSDSVLSDIFDYIQQAKPPVLSAARNKQKFVFKAPPKQYPYYKRTYMPFASPAAIAIMFSWDVGLSWDATSARLRYVFKSPQSFLNGEKNKDTLRQYIVHSESTAQLWSFAENTNAEFKGYSLSKDLPVFKYNYADVHIKEWYTPANYSEGFGFNRHFSISGLHKTSEDIWLDLSQNNDISEQSAYDLNIIPNKGRVTEYKLLLSPSQAQMFSIEYQFSAKKNTANNQQEGNNE
jgi:cytochrome c551/c552